MKKIYLLFILLISCCCLIHSQTGDNRTVETIIADVLSQMPAKKQTDYNLFMKSFASTGEAGVMHVKTLDQPGVHTEAAYALSGLSYFVMQNKQHESLRHTTAEAYCKALKVVQNNETKAFIIRQLEITGKDESIPYLASYLTDKLLCSAAARALVAIGNKQAGETLLSVLPQASKATQSVIVNALADIDMEETEKALLPLLNTGDNDFQKTVLFTLSKVGTAKSLKFLEKYARQAGFTMEPTGANEAYIALLKRVIQTNEAAIASKMASRLLKAAQKQQVTHTKNAALQILLSSQDEKKDKLILSALKDNDIVYRNAALNYVSNENSVSLYTGILSEWSTLTNGAKVDILNWLSRECNSAEALKALEKVSIKGESFASFIEQNMKVSCPFIKIASANVLSNMNSENAVHAIVQLLSDSDELVVSAALNLLMSYNGEITKGIADAFPSTNAGKIAALQLIAKRKDNKQINLVFEQIKTGSNAVKIEACKALKDVVTKDEIMFLFGLLESSDTDKIKFIQEGLISAVASLKKKEQIQLITSRIENQPKLRHLYFPVLATTEDTKALNFLITEFFANTGEIKDAAFVALCQAKSLEAANMLYQICEKDMPGSYQKKALDNYVKIVSLVKTTNEIRFMKLRKAMELAKEPKDRNQILTQIGKTGTYQALLYAGTFLNDKAVQQTAANVVTQIALENKTYTDACVTELLLKTMPVLNNPDADYQRQEIKNHIKEITPPQPFVLTQEELNEGFSILFDGTNMDQWTGNKEDYKLEQGCISLYPSDKKENRNLYTKETYADFVFRFEFQLTAAANNGLGIRTPLNENAAYMGMELQILDDSHPVYQKLKPYQFHGSIYGIVAAKRNCLKPLGEWNYQEVIAKGNKIKVILNGIVIVDSDIKEAVKNGIPDGKEHPGLFNKKGYIAFLGHGSFVKFRNIRIKKLD